MTRFLVLVAVVTMTPAASLACAMPGGLPQIASDVIVQVNAQRARAGLPRLTQSQQLQAAAQAHACDSARHDRMSHTGSDGSGLGTRLRRAGYPLRTATENVAVGHRTPQHVVTDWMGSSGHRENILDSTVREIGVGVALTPQGRAHWVMVSGATRG